MCHGQTPPLSALLSFLKAYVDRVKPRCKTQFRSSGELAEGSSACTVAVFINHSDDIIRGLGHSQRVEPTPEHSPHQVMSLHEGYAGWGPPEVQGGLSRKKSTKLPPRQR